MWNKDLGRKINKDIVIIDDKHDYHSNVFGAKYTLVVSFPDSDWYNALGYEIVSMFSFFCGIP